MRISFLGYRTVGTGSGGIERHVYEMATRFAAQGHEVNLFYRRRYQPEPPMLPAGVMAHAKPCIYEKHLENLSHTLMSLPEAIRRSDIVHFQAIGPTLLSWLPRLAGRKVVATVQALDFERAKWNAFAKRVLYASAWTAAKVPNVTICVSRPMQAFFQERFHCDAVYIPNGVSEPVIRPLERLKPLGLTKGGYIMALGRLVPEKGYHYLIEAYKQLDTELKLVIWGEHTHTQAYVEQLKRQAGDDPRILFPGPAFDRDKDEAFSDAKLFVLPSDIEGLPLVLLEAMSYGCPVLVSDIEANLDAFAERPDAARERLSGELGYVFKAGDVADLTARLQSVLARDDLGQTGARSRAFALDVFHWDKLAAQTLAVYESLLSGSR